MSFFRRVSVKSCLLRLITRMGNGALRNVMLSPEVFSSERPSRLTRKCLFLPSATSLISASSPITSGRTLRLCGATGVIMKLDALGATMGPPTLREYPVDPVGVATSNPSAWYVFRNVLSR